MELKYSQLSPFLQYCLYPVSRDKVLIDVLVLTTDVGICIWGLLLPWLGACVAYNAQLPLYFGT